MIHELPALLVIGAMILGGSLTGWLARKLRIPQVVGYIVAGIIAGKSGLHLLSDEEMKLLMPFNFFALGIIGFTIGGELHRDIFRKYGRQFFIILFSEAIGAFILVSSLVTLLSYSISGNLNEALALGLLLGAISSATAPAATVDVLWEYKCKGILTTTVLAIVALDDGVALLLYTFATSVTTRLLGTDTNVSQSILHIVREVGGALAIGGAGGLVLYKALPLFSEKGKKLALALGLLCAILGLSIHYEFDIILSAMVMGMLFTNLAPHRVKEFLYSSLERVSDAVYIIFFVLVGARLAVAGLPRWMAWMAGAYLLGRTMGKMTGAYLGARLANAPYTVRRYLGLCLFSQAGVAIGLAILAGMNFSKYYIHGVSFGDAIVMIVTTTTFVVQLIGPPCVKLAVKKAEETGLNITEEDLLESYTVGDVAARDVPVIPVGMKIEQILSTIAESDSMYFPVVEGNKIVGLISVEDLKQCFAEKDMSRWLVAYDLMHPVPDPIPARMRLDEALAAMKEKNLECIPVVASENSREYAGLLEVRRVQRRLSREVLKKKQQAAVTAEPSA